MSMRKTTLALGQLLTWRKVTSARRVTRCCTTGSPPLQVAPGQLEDHVNSYRCQTPHWDKVEWVVSGSYELAPRLIWQMYWFRFSRFQVQALKYMGHLGEIQFPFPFPSFLLDYFDVQDLKILLGIISFEIAVSRGPRKRVKRSPPWHFLIPKLTTVITGQRRTRRTRVDQSA